MEAHAADCSCSSNIFDSHRDASAAGLVFLHAAFTQIAAAVLMSKCAGHDRRVWFGACTSVFLNRFPRTASVRKHDLISVFVAHRRKSTVWTALTIQKQVKKIFSYHCRCGLNELHFSCQTQYCLCLIIPDLPDICGHYFFSCQNHNITFGQQGPSAHLQEQVST